MNRYRNHRWKGIHQVLGEVIYNPDDQKGLPPNKVRLHIVSENRTALFVKDIVRRYLANGNYSEPVLKEGDHGKKTENLHNGSSVVQEV